MIEPLDKQTFMEQMQKSEQAGDFSHNAVRRFYDWMYREQNGLVQACAFPVPTEDKSKQEMGQGKWAHVRSYDEFRDFCDTHSGLWRYHVYAGVNTLDETPDHGRGALDHIDRVRRLSFDIETDTESYAGASKEQVWWTYRYALAQIKFMSVEYGVWPLVVMSENGIHLHYRVDFPCTDDLLYQKQHMYCKYITHQAMNSRYVSKIEERTPNYIDYDQDDVSDPPRVMKVPGTRGIKSQTGRLCGIIHEPPVDKAGVIEADMLDVEAEDIEEITETNDSDKSPTRSVDTSPDDLQEDAIEKVKRLARNDDKFREYWRGNLSGYESRSEAEFGFVIKMLNHGFTESEIVDVMWASGMSKWEEESDHYRERTIENALDYFDGTVVKDSKDGTFSFS